MIILLNVIYIIIIAIICLAMSQYYEKNYISKDIASYIETKNNYVESLETENDALTKLKMILEVNEELKDSEITSLKNQCEVYKADYKYMLDRYRKLERDYYSYIRYNKKQADKVKCDDQPME